MQKLGKILMLLTIPWCLLLLAFAIAQSFEKVDSIGWAIITGPLFIGAFGWIPLLAGLILLLGGKLVASIKNPPKTDYSQFEK